MGLELTTQDNGCFKMETNGVAQRPADVACNKSNQSRYRALPCRWTEHVLEGVNRKNTTMLVALELLLTFLPVIPSHLKT